MSQKNNEYIINRYITLKLEESITNIYFNGILFQQCKYLLIDIPIDDFCFYDDIGSIDEAVEKGMISKEKLSDYIPSETEFWGHCSNLQVWFEND